FWNPARIPQPWMTDGYAPLARAFEPVDLEPLVRVAGVERTILVQSAARDDDTDYMFELAGHLPWIGGIVAWCRLDDRRRARERLAELARRPKLRGIRHVIHHEPDPHWIMQSSVQPALTMLENMQLVLELPAVYPDHLGDVPELARRHPGLEIVIDHLGKPPLGTAGMKKWEELLRVAAEQPNVYAKISGLNTVAPAGTWSGADLEPAVRVAFDALGPDRLVCGSDWPVALLNGDYERVWRDTTTAIELVAGPAAEQILTTTATTLYRLDT
ncbi:MAG: amidohydrolase family protein, partial [Gaiellaceae bacterium]